MIYKQLELTVNENSLKKYYIDFSIKYLNCIKLVTIVNDNNTLLISL